VTPGNRGEYMVSVRSSPAGETPASERMRFPFDEQGAAGASQAGRNCPPTLSAKTLRHMPSTSNPSARSYSMHYSGARSKAWCWKRMRSNSSG